MEKPVLVLLPLEHRGTDFITFAHPTRAGGDPADDVAVTMPFRTWLRMGGPSEIGVTLKPDPTKDLLPTVETQGYPT